MSEAELNPGPLRRALAEEPQTALAWQRLGLTIAAGGDVGSALAPLRRATIVSPRLAAPWESLGLALAALERWTDSAAAYRSALALSSGRADLAARLAEILAKAGRMTDAAQAFDLAIGLSPADHRLRHDRAVIRATLGDAAGALVDLRAALAASPNGARTHYLIAQCVMRVDGSAASEAWFARVSALDGQVIEALLNRGVIAQGRYDVSTARRSFRRAIALAPGDATAHGNFGALDMGLGRIGAAIRRTRRAMILAPDWVDAHSNLLLALGYLDIEPARYFAEHRRWEARHAAPAYASIRPCGNDPDPDRRLRVGYLSADFFEHALGTNIAGAIEHHDRREVEVHCYAQVGLADDMTRHISALADRFVETQGLDDAALADRIRDDRIDILVVVAGHTARNRLIAAARKPAPILVSYADFSTTGLSVMDYWLTDPIVHPEGATEELFTETLMRIPMMVLHRPIEVAPPVSALPAPSRGHVTFGSFNNPAKIGDEVVTLWSRLLARLPDARLMLKYRTVYEVPDVRDRLARRFAERGIDPVRIIFAGGDLNRPAHLGLVGEVDIGLDPFPFNGCTTTFEALWMGVPVVTLAGRRFLGRMGASFLTHLGLPELVAEDADGYVAAAAELASDLDRLSVLRKGLRRRILESPLCDAPSYSRSIEVAFRAAWRRWCEGRR